MVVLVIMEPHKEYKQIDWFSTPKDKHPVIRLLYGHHTVKQSETAGGGQVKRLSMIRQLKYYN